MLMLSILGVTEWWTALPIGLALLASLGVVVVFLQGSRDKGTMESQDRSISALKTELAVETQHRERLEGELKLANEKIARADDKIATLTEAVTQAAKVRELQTTLDTHHSTTSAALIDVIENQEKILEAIGAKS